MFCGAGTDARGHTGRCASILWRRAGPSRGGPGRGRGGAGVTYVGLSVRLFPRFVTLAGVRRRGGPTHSMKMPLPGPMGRSKKKNTARITVHTTQNGITNGSMRAISVPKPASGSYFRSMPSSTIM